MMVVELALLNTEVANILIMGKYTLTNGLSTYIAMFYTHCYVLAQLTILSAYRYCACT